jgi:ABC-type uncharacterized transport system involved in gliding motility auxiliary subunit
MAGQKGYDFRRTLVSTTGVGVLLAILILLNVIVSYANIRWDATEDKIYSLSEGTRNILAEMTEPVTAKFFFSRSRRDLPNHLKIYARRVRDFLGEYEHASRGKIKVEVFDPGPDSDEEEWAEKYGLRAVRTAAGNKIFAGLVFVAADREETIEWLDPAREELLEYDITRIIHRLQSYEKKIVGVLSSLPVTGAGRRMPGRRQPQGGDAWFFVKELRKTYEVRSLSLEAKRIDPGINLLMVIHPKGFSPQVQYAIDQYILAGGNALIFVDPSCVSDRRGRQQFGPSAMSSLDKLFAAWGLNLETGKAVADLDQTTRVRTGSNKVEDNPVWISARGEAFNAEDIVTSRLESMLFPVAGALQETADSFYEVEPLIRSGTNAGLINAFVAGFGAESIRSDITPTGERFNLAVRLRGKFKSAFPDGPPEGEKEESKADPESGEIPQAEHRDTAEGKSTVIIVADADMLADRFYVQRSNFLGFDVSKVFNDNLNFVANACEILTGSDDLIGLRSRGKFERPFTTVTELKRRAQERWLAKEKELLKQIEATNSKLRKLEQQKDSSQKLIISPEQEAEITKFRERKSRIKDELKEVRKKLRADIVQLGNILKAINIFLMPLMVSLAGMLFAVHKQRRMRRK